MTETFLIICEAGTKHSLEVGPIKIQLVSTGRPQTHFGHILCLGNASRCNSFNGFPDSQLTKFRALQSEQYIERPTA